MEMRRCMLVLGLVTTTNVAADHAQTEMHPKIPDPEALLAPIGARLTLVHLAQVGAAVFLTHNPSHPWSCYCSDACRAMPHSSASADGARCEHHQPSGACGRCADPT